MMNSMQSKRTFTSFRLCSVVLIAILAVGTISSLLAEKPAKSGGQIDDLLRDAVKQKKVAGVVAMVSSADKISYQGAAGKQDSTKNIPMAVSSIFRIASMTKPVTS